MGKKANENQPLLRGEFLEHKGEFLELKGEFHEFKNEMFKFRNDVAHWFLKSERAMEDFKQAMFVKFDRIFNLMDAFKQRNEDHDNKVLFHGHRLKDLETKSSDHETRLTRLESK